VYNAISDRRKTARLAYDLANRGDTFLLDDASGLCHNNDTSISVPVQCAQQQVDTIFLNDLLPLMSQKRALMKIDVQGHEINVFTELTAARFFDNIDVLSVYMEWEEFTSAVSANDGKKVKKAQIEELLNFFYARRYSAFDTYYRKLSSNWTTWPNNILMQKD
jgi:Methyltransferase FkbM domain